MEASESSPAENARRALERVGSVPGARRRREMVIEGDRVASRFVVSGKCLGRRVRLNGITISRFENGLILEDWWVTDSLGML